MATKWKNYSRAWYFKVIAWLLVLICISGSVSLVWYGSVTYSQFPVTSIESDLQNLNNKYDMNTYLSTIVEKFVWEQMYKNKDKLDLSEIVDAQMENAYQEWKALDGGIQYEIGTDYYSHNNHLYKMISEVDIAPIVQDGEESTSYTKDGWSAENNNTSAEEGALSYQVFLEKNPKLKEYLEICLKEQIRCMYEQGSTNSDTSDAVYQIVKKDSKQWKKIKETYKEYPTYAIYENGIVTSLKGNPVTSQNMEEEVSSWESEDSTYAVPMLAFTENNMWYEVDYAKDIDTIWEMWMENYATELLSRYQIAVGLPQKNVQTIQEEWQTTQAEFKEAHSYTVQCLRYCIILLLLAMIGILYLLVTAGRTSDDDELHFTWLERIWSEVQIGIGLLTFMFAGIAIIGVVLERHYVEVNGEMLTRNLGVSIFGRGNALLILNLITVVSTIVLGSLILSQVRRLKAKKWLDGFICIRVIRSMWNGIKAIWTGGRFMIRMGILAVVVPILSATWIGLPFMIAFLLFLVYRYGVDFEQLQEGVKKIKKGDLQYQIHIENKGVMRELANDINTISEGLRNAIDSEVRSERMKAELISNVSHDIKTPLTSIITYVDLLKKEEIDNEVAQDYIAVIDNKAQRLKVLTDDLFEAAKASSGDMPVHLEKVNVQSFIQQSLGEFEEKLERARLAVRVTMPEQPVYILADGRLMWRVTSNLLNNIVKYAQEGSRVYLEVIKNPDNKNVSIVFKNISAYELNIDAEELMERFTRGDESRSTEGSGLGLNIANSLIALQNGQFTIFIDGDLFKVSVTMPSYEETFTKEVKQSVEQTEEENDIEGEEIDEKEER